MKQYVIDLEKISFEYDNHKVIRDLSLQVKKNEHIGIVGDSGCGKSTLLRLLAGLYEPSSGRMMIAGKMTPEKIRTKVGMVMQSNSLFPLSIRDNITCGHQVSEDTVREACKGASLMQWIEELPEGLDTNVGERGNQVSGGQAQRIQIARALCKNAPVVLLDEPTSALDKDTRSAVINALNKLMEGKTVVHITHQPELLDNSYIIYRMEGGRLIRE